MENYQRKTTGQHSHNYYQPRKPQIGKQYPARISRHEEEYKCHFDAYLNIAQNNFFNLIWHIALKYCPDKLQSVDSAVSNEITKAQEDSLTILQEALREEDSLLATKVQDELSSNLPFFEPLFKYMEGKAIPKKDKDRQDLDYQIENRGDLLHCLGEDIRCIRNASIHPHTIKDYQKLIVDATFMISPLTNLFDQARREIKTRRNLTDREVSFLTNPLYRYDKETNKGITKYKEKASFYYGFRTRSDVLSDTGIVFFTCLFLEKKHIVKFLDNTILKNHVIQEEEKGIIRNIFSFFRMRQVKERVDCTLPNDAMAMDILNELSKCPVELYDVLPIEQKRKFVIDVDGNEVLMVRHSDRFPALALKYFDSFKIFERLRFQSFLGNYHFKFYDKKCIDGQSRVRTLQKEVKGLGRLQEIEEKRKTEWGDLLKVTDPNTAIPLTADSSPYVSDCRAKYVFNANRVAISFVDYFPTAKELSGHKEQNWHQAWLSTFELPAMLFLSLMDKDGARKCEKIISQHISAIKRLLKDIETGTLQKGCGDRYTEECYGLKMGWIPEKIRDYITDTDYDAEKRFAAHAVSIINDEIGMAERWSKRIISDLEKQQDKSKAKKPGKKGSQLIKEGYLAEVLAKDIIKIQPSDAQGRNKLTGQNFAVLQASLALYKVNLSSLQRIFETAGLLSGNYAHPFVHKVIEAEPSSIKDFAKMYFDEKVKYYNNCLKEHSYSICQVAKPTSEKWKKRDTDYYVRLAKRYQEQPIELPRGLFYNAILDVLRAKGKSAGWKQVFAQEKLNSNYLIQCYQKLERRDSQQEFYTYGRTYRVFNILKNQRDRQKKLVEQVLSLDERTAIAHNIEKRINNYVHSNMVQKPREEKDKLHGLFCKYKRTERAIRQYAVQDIVMLMLAEEILGQKSAKGHLKLSNVKGGKFFFDAPIDISVGVYDHKITDRLSPKDYPKLFNVIHDKRLKTLLASIDEEILKLSLINEEFNNFDDERIEVFRLAGKLEDWVVNNLPPEKVKKITFNKIADLLKDILDKKEIETIKELRNCFAHSFYPPKDKLNLVHKHLPEIADTMEKEFDRLIKKHPENK